MTTINLTPLGCGERWGGMPDLDGRGMDWVRYHDKYGEVADSADACCRAQEAHA